jgi:carbamoyltransferase
VMWILGVSCFRDDATAALLHDGCIVGIAEEERFLRIKHAVYEPGQPVVSSLDESHLPDDFELRFFPSRAIAYLLSAANIRLDEVDIIAHDFDYASRIANFAAFKPISDMLNPDEADLLKSSWQHCNEMLEDFARKAQARLIHVAHHCAHAAGAVFGSGFDRSKYLVIDALGELSSVTMGEFDGKAFRDLAHTPLPYSAGLLYTAVTHYLGFRPFSEEQKTMGLAAYGTNRYDREFRKLLRTTDASLWTDSDYVWTRGIKMGVGRESPLPELFGAPPRPRGCSALNPPYPDVAASLQFALEAAVFALLDQLGSVVSESRLCLGGGVALNCSMNGKIALRSDVGDLFVQPQAGDSGTALGAAYHAHWSITGSRPEPLQHAYWGPGFDNREIAVLLERLKLPHRHLSHPAPAAAELLAAGRIVGWFQGRSECGPRALGNRSILAHPGLEEMKDRINRWVKGRETWRPFAASLLYDDRGRYLVDDIDSRYMLLALQLTEVGQRDLVAAAHKDGTTRPQLVSQKTNARFYELLTTFKQLTGISGVLNTSLNLADEPIVNSPQEAIHDFYLSGMDDLVLGDYLLSK